MQTQIISQRGIDADKLLKASVSLWYSFAVIGLSAFLIYVLVHYGKQVLGFENISSGEVNGETSFIKGDTLGNFVLATHLSLALVVISGGLLQLYPPLRSAFPRFHRLNGRLFVTCAVVCSLAGQYLIQTREIPGGFMMHLGTMCSGVLVLVFSVLAVKSARARRFEQHRKWAMRLFLVANAGWFFRIGLMLWFVVNQGPVGIDLETFTGPALVFIAYAQFLIPLFFLELYLRAQRSVNQTFKVLVASVIFVSAIATLAGVGAASAMMWFPNIL